MLRNAVLKYQEEPNETISLIVEKKEVLTLRNVKQRIGHWGKLDAELIHGAIMTSFHLKN